MSFSRLICTSQYDRPWKYQNKHYFSTVAMSTEETLDAMHTSLQIFQWWDHYNSSCWGDRWSHKLFGTYFKSSFLLLLLITKVQGCGQNNCMRSPALWRWSSEDSRSSTSPSRGGGTVFVGVGEAVCLFASNFISKLWLLMYNIMLYGTRCWIVWELLVHMQITTEPWQQYLLTYFIFETYI